MAPPEKGGGSFKPLITDRPSKKQRRRAKKAAERKHLQDNETSAPQTSSEAAGPSDSTVTTKTISTAEDDIAKAAHSNTFAENEGINAPESAQPYLVPVEKRLDWATDATAEAEAHMQEEASTQAKAEARPKVQPKICTRSQFVLALKAEAKTRDEAKARWRAENPFFKLAPKESQVSVDKPDDTNRHLFKEEDLNTSQQGSLSWRKAALRRIKFGTFEEPWDIPSPITISKDDFGAKEQELREKPSQTLRTVVPQPKSLPQVPVPVPVPLQFPMKLSTSLYTVKNPREMTLTEKQALTRGAGPVPVVTVWTTNCSNGLEGEAEQYRHRVGVVRKRLLEHFSKKAGKELKNAIRQDWNVRGVTSDAMSILLEWMTKSCGTLNIQNVRTHDVTVKEWLNVWEAAAILESDTAQWKLADQMYADIKSLSIPELLEAWCRANIQGAKQLETATSNKLYGIVRNKRDMSLEELACFWTYGSGNDHLMRKAVEAFAKPSFYDHYAGRKGVDESKIEGFDELDAKLKDLVRWSWKYEENKCHERRSAGWFKMRERQASMTPEERESDRQREKKKFESRKQKREQDRLDSKTNTELAARIEEFWANKDNSAPK